MSIQDLAAFAEIIASLGVIVSLIYVARQIRQANTLNRSAAQQAINTQFTDITNSVAASPELTTVLAKVHFKGLVRDDATDEERIQLGYFFNSITNQLYFMYQQMQEGILTEKEVEEWQASTALLNAPYLNSLWPVLAGTYPQDFQRWIEARANLDRPPEGFDPLARPDRNKE